jgi:SAM-dependent methyltransferase
MKLKPDWTTWLHSHKRREMAVFKNCPRPCFPRGLELGAGDGFQSALLSPFVERLVSTDINGNALPKENAKYIQYRMCAAEDAPKLFQEKSFDMIFSSNLLEHTADPVKALQGVHALLKDDGITVHLMPSPFWIVCRMALHLPAKAIVLLERITREAGIRNSLCELRAVLRECRQGIFTGTNATLEAVHAMEMKNGNNPGTLRARPGFLRSLVAPQPHGVSKTNWAEFRAFGKKQWVRVLGDAGFSCIAVRKGPAASGYGLGWSFARKAAQRLGLSSEYIYIAKKRGCESRYSQYFKGNLSRAFF